MLSIKENNLSARKLIEMSNVVYIGTTDDPADDLIYHKKIREDESFECKVRPTFRPDRALKIKNEGFIDYIKALGKIRKCRNKRL